MHEKSDQNNSNRFSRFFLKKDVEQVSLQLTAKNAKRQFTSDAMHSRLWRPPQGKPGLRVWNVSSAVPDA